MKSPTGKTVLPTVKLIDEKSGLPTRAAISGVSKSLVRAVTTPPKAAPITTPTAISITLPRRMNCLNPLSMKGSLLRTDGGNFTADCRRRQAYAAWLGGEDARPPSSDSHRHHDVAVLVLFAFGRAHLAGGLGIFEFE